MKQRQSLAAEADEDELSKAFKGGVTLTFREDETITLTPEQARSHTCEITGCPIMI